jgi:hypothetical protein
MAPDDRDRTFEKALARQLRSSASSGADANALAGVPAERSIEPLAELCPDPEMLAAYHDGSLSAEERNFWKPHVLSCDRCQLVLAHLETPLDIPVSTQTNEEVLVSQQPVSSGETASPVRIARPSFLHSLRWLWLVPAGAIAAFLIVWVSLQRQKPSPLAPPSSVEVAENRQPLAAEPSTKPTLTAPSDSKESKEKVQPAAPAVGVVAGRLAVPTRDLASNDSQNQRQMPRRIQSQTAATPAHGPFVSQQKQEQQIGGIAAGSAGGVLAKKLDEPAKPIARERAVEALAQPATIPPPPPPPPASSEPSFLDSGSVSATLKDKALPAPAPKPAPAAPSGAAAPKSQAAGADAISAVTESVEVSAAPETAFNGRAMMRAAALQNPHVIAAPGAKQLWRIGPAGLLEHSKDKGLNWISQISGVYTDLLAGSAPSGKVCWIVGASGTILRTIDGGTHWSKLDSPITNNLTGVRATDAMHASIWLVPDQQTGLVKTYQTSDGGSTWVSAPSE